MFASGQHPALVRTRRLVLFFWEKGVWFPWITLFTLTTKRIKNVFVTHRSLGMGLCKERQWCDDSACPYSWWSVGIQHRKPIWQCQLVTHHLLPTTWSFILRITNSAILTINILHNKQVETADGMVLYWVEGSMGWVIPNRGGTDEMLSPCNNVIANKTAQSSEPLESTNGNSQSPSCLWTCW